MDRIRSLADIDWSRWQPTERATLCFVVDGDRILLIRKKRGLGAGKVNAPGGRIEPGEAPHEAAAREVLEEVGVSVGALREHGELRFQFVDGYALHCHVFRADTHHGQAFETDEATPLWTPIDRLPFSEMWADDAIWLPILLAGECFDGRFIFDGDAMLDFEVAKRA